jgi:hypothetical protein
MDGLGRDVIEMLDAPSMHTVSFCGLSKGGMVGQWLGVRAPERASADWCAPISTNQAPSPLVAA